MRGRRLAVSALVLAWLLWLPTRGMADQAAVRLDHLDWLKRPVKLAGGRTATTWQIYASPARARDRSGPYRFVPAPGEGVGCVDDAARAAIVYLRHHERTGSPASLASALVALEFVRALRAGDGTYWNFVEADGSINETGPTSRKGLNWWTARAFWATAEAIRVLRPRLAGPIVRQLELDARRTVSALTRDLEGKRGRFETEGPARLPGWLVGGAADVTAVFVLGLASLYEAAPGRDVRDLLDAHATGILLCERGDALTFPFHAHPPSRAVTYWHAYGAHMLQALARAGRLLGRGDLIDGARREADHLSLHLLICGGPIWGLTPAPRTYPQIAYGLSPQVLGLLELFRATGDRKYRTMAGLMGSWLTGNNPAGSPVHDPATGRVFDGIDPEGVSFDSGAESTIEGLMALIELGCHPEVAPLLAAREIARLAPVVLEAESGAGPVVAREPFSNGKGIALAPGRSMTIRATLAPGSYLLAPAVVRAPGAGEGDLRCDVAGPAGPAGRRRFVAEVRGASFPLPTVELARPVEASLGPAVEITVGRDAGSAGAVELDGVVAQPVVEYRVFSTPSGSLVAIRNLSALARPLALPDGRRMVVGPRASMLVEEKPDAWVILFLAELGRRPAAQARDLYKFTHQSVFGPAHAAPDRASARRWLAGEMASLGPTEPGEPLVERLSAEPPLVRINLRPYRDTGRSGEALLDLFDRAAGLAGDPGLMARRIAAARGALEAAGRRDLASGLEALAREMAPRGWPAIHHGEVYDRAYRPAYRVVHDAGRPR